MRLVDSVMGAKNGYARDHRQTDGKTSPTIL